VGTSGEAPDRTIVVDSVEAVDRLEVSDPERLAFRPRQRSVCMTLREIVTRLRQKFPKIVGPKSDDICYARKTARKQSSKWHRTSI